MSEIERYGVIKGTDPNNLEPQLDGEWVRYSALVAALAKARAEERERLFSVMLHGIKGCSSHSCLIKRPEGMGTNGPCKCSENRTTMNILLSRIRALDEEVL